MYLSPPPPGRGGSAQQTDELTLAGATHITLSFCDGAEMGPSSGAGTTPPTIPFSLWRGWTHNNLTEARPAPQRLSDLPWLPATSGCPPRPDPSRLTVLGVLSRAPAQAVLQQLVGAGGAGSRHQAHGGFMQEHLAGPRTQAQRPHLSVSLGASLPAASHLPPDHTPSPLHDTLPCSPFENNLSRPHSDPGHTPGRKGEQHRPAGGAGVREHTERQAKGHLCGR